MSQAPTRRSAILLLVMLLGVMPSPLRADEQTTEYRVIGLFEPGRQKDFQAVLADVPEFQLVHLDYENARGTFRYDPRVLFPTQNPKKVFTPLEIQQRLNQILAKASEGTFSLKPLSELPAEKLTKLDVGIGILDCKGCRYCAYMAVQHVPGVERATVGADRVITAWVDPAKVDRAAIEAALTKAHIEIVAKP